MARPPRRPAAPGSAPRPGSAADDVRPAEPAAASAPAPSAAPGRPARTPRTRSTPAAPRPPRPASSRRGAGPRRPRSARAGAVAASSQATAWLAGVRGSGFTLLVMVIMIIAVVVLAPGIRTFVEQRAQIAELQHSVDAAKADAADLDQEQARWSDPAFIRAQARERLYFVMPGEVSYLVIDDVTIPTEDEAPVSDTLQTTSSDWVDDLLSSLAVSGLGEPSADQLGTAP